MDIINITKRYSENKQRITPRVLDLRRFIDTILPVFFLFAMELSPLFTFSLYFYKLLFIIIFFVDFVHILTLMYIFPIKIKATMSAKFECII